MKVVLLCFNVLLTKMLFADSFLENAKHINLIIDDVIEQNYTESFQKADLFRVQNHKLEYWTSQALIYHALMIDYESFDSSAVFFRSCDSAFHYANFLTGKQRPYGLLAKGIVEGFRANILLRVGNTISSASAALSMRKHLNECIQLNPNLFDAYVGLGSYDYWSSKALSLLPFLGDNRERGILRIQEAEQKSILHSTTATTALIWINIDRKKYQEAVLQSEAMLKKYPNARTFLWSAGEAAYHSKDWNSSIRYYEVLLESLQSDDGQKNYFNELGCYHRLIEMYRKIGEIHRAKKYIQKANSLRLSDEIKKRKRKDIKNITQWSKELN